jgi:ribosome-binding protein aMBF1 (putative translation factor)
VEAKSWTSVQDWLATKPSEKTRVAYERWRRACNQKLESGQRPLLSAEGVQGRWPFPWPEIVEAVEEERLPGKTKDETDAEEAQEAGETLEQEEAGDAPARFNLDPRLRDRRLRSAREAKGWSLKQLSEKTGIDRSHLRKIDKGEIRQPSFDLIAKLADALGLSLDALVTDEENLPNSFQ